MSRPLRGCDVVPLDEDAAHAVGALLTVTRTTDIADASVVVSARGHVASIVTSDRADLEHLLEVTGGQLHLTDV